MSTGQPLLMKLLLPMTAIKTLQNCKTWWNEQGLLSSWNEWALGNFHLNLRPSYSAPQDLTGHSSLDLQVSLLTVTVSSSTTKIQHIDIKTISVRWKLTVLAHFLECRSILIAAGSLEFQRTDHNTLTAVSLPRFGAKIWRHSTWIPWILSFRYI